MRKALPEVADLAARPVEGQTDEDGNPMLEQISGESEADAVWYDWSGRIEYDPPDGDLDKFNGKLFNSASEKSSTRFLEKDNVLLRGCELRNCAYIYGMAVYTGYDCKINFGGESSGRNKIASLTAMISKFVLVMCVIQAALCLIGATGNTLWIAGNAAGAWYLRAPSGGGNFVDWIQSFFTYFLLTSQLVPISLYVSIKMSQQAQKYVMDRDVDMAVVDKRYRWKPTWTPKALAKCLRKCGCGASNHSEPSAAAAVSPSQRPSSDNVQRVDAAAVLAGKSTSSSSPILSRRSARARGMSRGAGSSVHVVDDLEAAPQGCVLPTEVRTMELNDELGQITHVLSDKTGTLTKNMFSFKCVSIAGIRYGEATTQIGVITARAKARTEEDKAHVAKLEELLARGNAVECHVEKVKFLDDPKNPWADAAADPARATDIQLFMQNLALEHTVELEPVGDSIKYSSASPDEEAFAYAAKYFGWQFVTENGNVRTLRIRQPDGSTKDSHFRVWALLPFSSARGMMSMLIENLNVPESDPYRIALYAKGADNAIYEKLKPLPGHSSSDSSADARQSEIRAATDRHIKEFGVAGLRAMAFAVRPVGHDDAMAWMSKWNAARAASGEEKRTAMTAAMDELEREMLLQGATAIEDQLQDDVAETIATLAKANIKIYMLTGDQESTAINIAFGVNMLTSDYEQHIITLGRFQRQGIIPEDEGSLMAWKDSSTGATGPGLVKAAIRELRLKLRYTVPDKPQALIIDKDALAILLDSQATCEDLVNVAEQCTSVVCCRCRPKQKEAMVRLIQKHVPGSKCLAIGDGANDVDMINAAHVGVGILGAEGSGAANSSDFKIPQFKVLQKLLLVHGRQNYNRMALLVAFMFYKNAFFTLAQYAYVARSAWSGQRFYMEAATQAFNLLYTGVPVLFVAVMDQSADADTAQRFPALYRASQRGDRLSVKLFMLWIISAAFEATVTSLFTEHGMRVPLGASPSVYELGTAVFSLVVVVATVRLALHTSMHHWMYQFLLAASVLVWVITALLMDATNAENFRGGVVRLFGTPTFWVVTLLASVVALLPTLLFLVWRAMFKPNYTSLVREAQVLFRNGAHASFESVPRRQRALYKCEAGSGSQRSEPRLWKEVEAHLLLHAVREAAHENMAARERADEHFNENVYPIWRAGSDLSNLPTPNAPVPRLTPSERNVLLRRIIAIDQNTLVQFGKLPDTLRVDDLPAIPASLSKRAQFISSADGAHAALDSHVTAPSKGGSAAGGLASPARGGGSLSFITGTVSGHPDASDYAQCEATSDDASARFATLAHFMMRARGAVRAVTKMTPRRSPSGSTADASQPSARRA